MGGGGGRHPRESAPQRVKDWPWAPWEDHGGMGEHRGGTVDSCDSLAGNCNAAALLKAAAAVGTWG
eukprot:4730936-Pyramimonas_sp.AAC.1